MKNEVRGVTFDSPESAVEAYRGVLRGPKTGRLGLLL